MLRIAIIDDEKNVRVVIKKLLELNNIHHEIVGEATSVKKAKKLIESTKPDIVLLDVKLDDGTGFDLLTQLKTVDFKLIFITAYNNFAINAIKFNTIDYILKPIDPEELKNAIQKAEKAISENRGRGAQKLVVKTNQETHIIPIKDIIYIQSEGSYAKIYTNNLILLASKNLKFFEDSLPEQQFIRSHKSYLVNKLCIISIKKDILELKSDYKALISKRKKSEVLDLFK